MTESFQLFHALLGPDDTVSTLGNGVPWEANYGVSSTCPLGPFTGYAAILKHSSFLKPAQHLLDDTFGSGLRVPIAPLVPAGDQRFDRLLYAYGFKNNFRLVLMLDEVRICFFYIT